MVAIKHFRDIECLCHCNHSACVSGSQACECKITRYMSRIPVRDHAGSCPLKEPTAVFFFFFLPALHPGTSSFCGGRDVIRFLLIGCPNSWDALSGYTVHRLHVCRTASRLSYVRAHTYVDGQIIVPVSLEREYVHQMYVQTWFPPHPPKLSYTSPGPPLRRVVCSFVHALRLSRKRCSGKKKLWQRGQSVVQSIHEGLRT